MCRTSSMVLLEILNGLRKDDDENLFQRFSLIVSCQGIYHGADVAV